ncbi:nucleotidyl transferase AbiEii/AbiGii toxin family protein [Thalassospira lucentensis]|jgi:nucleotidyltransferase AbiEii toxin of type IV toxin-antitoxin system|uniref:nucleotidyl transferase AbiEii/AbiGii toxin family protein n=1 Tax=Thalassospira lucentensis TaxID=168935 RepID=UPI003D2D88D1
MAFLPRMDILPDAQRDLWPDFKDVTQQGWVLYGGTAVALRLGHRQSVDFDFFSDRPLDRDGLQSAFTALNDSRVIQEEQNAITLLVNPPGNTEDTVKVSFFGNISTGRVATPDMTDDGVLQVAALDDLMAMKLKVILQRAEAKDYRDIAAMVDAGIHVDQGLSAARQMFGDTFQPSESLKAMTFFGDGDLHTLTSKERATLVNTASAVSRLPDVALKSRSLIDERNIQVQIPHALKPYQAAREKLENSGASEPETAVARRKLAIAQSYFDKGLLDVPGAHSEKIREQALQEARQTIAEPSSTDTLKSRTTAEKPEKQTIKKSRGTGFEM